MQIIISLQPAVIAGITCIKKDETSGAVPPGTYKPTLLMGINLSHIVKPLIGSIELLISLSWDFETNDMFLIASYKANFSSSVTSMEIEYNPSSSQDHCSTQSSSATVNVLPSIEPISNTSALNTRIYDLNGNLVKVLYDNEIESNTFINLIWDSSGHANGIYFIYTNWPGGSDLQKVTLLK